MTVALVGDVETGAESVPALGPETMLKVSALPSGSDPVRVIVSGDVPLVTTTCASAVGAEVGAPAHDDVGGRRVSERAAASDRDRSEGVAAAAQAQRRPDADDHVPVRSFVERQGGAVRDDDVARAGRTNERRRKGAED